MEIGRDGVCLSCQSSESGASTGVQGVGCAGREGSGRLMGRASTFG